METENAKQESDLVTGWDAPEVQNIIKPAFAAMKKYGVNRMSLVVKDGKLQWLLEPEEQTLSLWDREEVAKENEKLREALSGRTVSCGGCNEAQAKLSRVYQWIERHSQDGFIDELTHDQNLDRIADAWAEKEEAMREAIKELQNIANAKPAEWGEMSDEFQPWAQNRAKHTLAKLEPFIKP